MHGIQEPKEVWGSRLDEDEESSEKKLDDMETKRQTMRKETSRL